MPVIGLRFVGAAWVAALAIGGVMLPTAALASSDPSISCYLTTTPLIFGEYRPYQGGVVDLTSSMTITCTTSGRTAVHWDGTITLTGARPSNNRQLTQGANTLKYQLFLDPARTRLWGDGSGQGSSLPISGTVSSTIPYSQKITIYGRIPGMQLSASVDHYVDIITATLDY